MIRVDPQGSLTDVAGISVGHHHRIRGGWRTGTTAILAPNGATAGVDVRGGGPGTRETDLLRPENLISEVHGICLTGGSAYGLAAAGGMMRWLETRRIGFLVGQSGGPRPEWVVPIVPGAVIFDLGRGGAFGNRPDDDFGFRAARAARRTPEANGAVGAGAGAIAGGLQGAVGSASVRLANGIVVAALAVVNAAGSVIDPQTCLPWEARAHRLRRPNRADRDLFARATAAPSATETLNTTTLNTTTLNTTTLNTTIGVVATSARLTKAECTKVASVSHDGMARAIRPVHSMFDGDTVFTLATGVDELPAAATTGFRSEAGRPAALNAILDAAAQCFAAACTQAIVSATSIGGPLAYRDLCPSAFRKAVR